MPLRRGAPRPSGGKRAAATAGVCRSGTRWPIRGCSWRKAGETSRSRECCGAASRAPVPVTRTAGTCRSGTGSRCADARGGRRAKQVRGARVGNVTCLSPGAGTSTVDGRSLSLGYTVAHARMLLAEGGRDEPESGMLRHRVPGTGTRNADGRNVSFGYRRPVRGCAWRKASETGPWSQSRECNVPQPRRRYEHGRRPEPVTRVHRGPRADARGGRPAR